MLDMNTSHTFTMPEANYINGLRVNLFGLCKRLLTRSSVKRLRSLIGKTVSLEVQKLLSSMTKNKNWRRPYLTFGGLFPQTSGSFFLRNNIYQGLFDNILFIVYKIFRHFVLLLANRNVAKSTKL